MKKNKLAFFILMPLSLMVSQAFAQENKSEKTEYDS